MNELDFDDFEAKCEAHEDELRSTQGPIRDGIYRWGEELVVLVEDGPTWLVIREQADDEHWGRLAVPRVRRAEVSTSLHICAATMAAIIRDSKDEELREHARNELRRALESV